MFTFPCAAALGTFQRVHSRRSTYLYAASLADDQCQRYMLLLLLLIATDNDHDDDTDDSYFIPFRSRAPWWYVGLHWMHAQCQHCVLRLHTGASTTRLLISRGVRIRTINSKYNITGDTDDSVNKQFILGELQSSPRNILVRLSVFVWIFW